MRFCLRFLRAVLESAAFIGLLYFFLSGGYAHLLYTVSGWFL